MGHFHLASPSLQVCRIASSFACSYLATSLPTEWVFCSIALTRLAMTKTLARFPAIDLSRVVGLVIWSGAKLADSFGNIEPCAEHRS